MKKYQPYYVLRCINVFSEVRVPNDCKQTNMESITHTSTRWHLRYESMYTCSRMKCRDRFTIKANCQTPVL
jgi:hypothetical protein